VRMLAFFLHSKDNTGTVRIILGIMTSDVAKYVAPGHRTFTHRFCLARSRQHISMAGNVG
jgi:membrane-bound metal-dependent hydrolase YbcI (DUF457 family)